MTNITARFVCAQQIMSDMDASDLIREKLLNTWSDGVEKSESDDKPTMDIKDHNVLACVTGTWGLQYVVFTVDIEIDATMTYSLAEKRVRKFLNDEVIGDTDVEVLWAGTAE